MTYDQSGWTKWIAHNGRGCPVKAGTIVEVEDISQSGEVRRAVVQSLRCSSAAVSIGLTADGSWDWRNAPRATRVIRYRIKRPLGLSKLEECLKVKGAEKINV